MRLASFGLLASLIFAFTFSVERASALTVTTLNLEWFGRGGEMHGNPTDEYRLPTIKELVDTYLNTTDVFVFQEILDVTGLFSVLPGWDCRTYQPENLEHQHVAICAVAGLIEKDSVIDAVKVSWGLRPALRVDLNLPSGKKLSVVGLHLKAGKEGTEVRLDQLRKLMANVEKDVPMLVMGDFNTFPKNRTGLSEDDVSLMLPIFEAQQFSQVGGEEPTYLGFERRTFDRVWQRNVEVTSHDVLGPCQEMGGEPTHRFTLESFYTRFVSDHCPVSVDIVD